MSSHTKLESTHQRNKQFSEWIRKECPDSWSGYRVYDIDYVVWKKEYINGRAKITKIMVIEEKNGSSEVSEDFRLMANFLHKAIQEQCRKDGVEYLGLHLVQLETGNPDTGKIRIDTKEVSKEELKSFMEFNGIPSQRQR